MGLVYPIWNMVKRDQKIQSFIFYMQNKVQRGPGTYLGSHSVWVDGPTVAPVFACKQTLLANPVQGHVH